MPQKLYQECRAVMTGCRAIFEDLLDAGVEQIPLNVTERPHSSSVTETSLQAQERSADFLVAPPVDEALDDIQRDLAGCTRCRLSSARKQIVFGAGNPNARLVLVGAAPGALEEEQDTPFADEAGKLLERILFAMKLSREQVYICYVAKCRPESDRPPDTDEAATCETFLKRQLAAISPEVILSLGQIATQALLQTETPIGALRGHWQTYAGIPLMPTFHPGFLLQNPAGKHQVWEDVKQVMHRLQDDAV